MAWTWQLESNDSKDLSAIDVPEFEDQGEAETWIGDRWQELLEQGVDSVTLVEDGEVIYTGMSLHPPS